MNNTIYLLDANIFIEASRRYYSFDIAPTFWEKLVDVATQGKIITIDKVEAEILERNKSEDMLSAWFKKEFSPFVKSTKVEKVGLKYVEIVNWVNTQKVYGFSEAAKREFFEVDNADAWIIAYALANECTIVTHEVFKKNIKRKIPIPNVCIGMGVNFIDTFEMMRVLGIKL